MKNIFKFALASVAVAFAGFVLWSCSTNESEVIIDFDYYDWSGKEIYLKTDKVVTIDTIIDYIMSVKREGNYYLIEYPYDCALYKEVGDKLVFDKYLIRKGGAPYETASSTRLSNLNDGRYFLGECIGSQKIFVSPTSNPEDLSDITRWETQSRENPSLPFFFESIQPVNDEMLIGSTLGNNSSKFASYNLKTKQYNALDWAYPAIYNELSDAQKAFTMEGTLLKKPNENKYLFKPNIGFAMFVFDCDGNKINNEKYIFNRFAAFGQGTDGENSRPRLLEERTCPYGISACVANNYIYMRGKVVTIDDIFGENSTEDYAYTDVIDSFDWNGKQHKRYLLDRKVKLFNVNTDDSALYGIVEGDEGDEIVIYNLPK